MTKLEELKSKHAELKTQILEESKAFFKSESAHLFQSNPSLESFSWKQYTPYFNDGEECVFSANTDYVRINDVEDSEWASRKTLFGGKENKDYDPVISEIYPQVKEFLKNFDDETMKEMFGDHCQITVTRDEVKVDGYDHD